MTYNEWKWHQVFLWSHVKQVFSVLVTGYLPSIFCTGKQVLSEPDPETLSGKQCDSGLAKINSLASTADSSVLHVWSPKKAVIFTEPNTKELKNKLAAELSMSAGLANT